MKWPPESAPKDLKCPDCRKPLERSLGWYYCPPCNMNRSFTALRASAKNKVKEAL